MMGVVKANFSAIMLLILLSSLVPLAFAFGADADDDGTPDESDLCPNSFGSNAVDYQGCSCAQKTDSSCSSLFPSGVCCPQDNNPCTDSSCQVNDQGIFDCYTAYNSNPCDGGTCSQGNCVAASPPNYPYPTPYATPYETPYGYPYPTPATAPPLAPSPNPVGNSGDNADSELQDALDRERQQLLGKVGDYDLLVVLFTIPTSQFPALDRASVETLMNGAQPASVKSYFRAASYGKFNVNSDVFGPFLLPQFTANDCFSPTFDIDRLFLNETVRNIDALTDFNKYEGVLFQTNLLGCGEIRGGATSIPLSFPTNDGTISIPNGFVFNYDERTRTTSYFTTIHEFGHMLGLSHAQKTECFDCNSELFQNDLERSYDVPAYNIQRINDRIRGDLLDPMGGGLNHMIASHKNLLGWFSPQTALVTNGTFRLHALERSPAQGTILELKLPLSNPPPALAEQKRREFANLTNAPNLSWFYSLEFRQADSFDARLPSGLLESPIIHLSYDSKGASLLRPFVQPTLTDYSSLSQPFTVFEEYDGQLYSKKNMVSQLPIGAPLTDYRNNYRVSLIRKEGDIAEVEVLRLDNAYKQQNPNTPPIGQLRGVEVVSTATDSRIPLSSRGVPMFHPYGWALDPNEPQKAVGVKLTAEVFVKPGTNLSSLTGIRGIRGNNLTLHIETTGARLQNSPTPALLGYESVFSTPIRKVMDLSHPAQYIGNHGFIYPYYSPLFRNATSISIHAYAQDTWNGPEVELPGSPFDYYFSDTAFGASLDGTDLAQVSPLTTYQNLPLYLRIKGGPAFGTATVEIRERVSASSPTRCEIITQSCPSNPVFVDATLTMNYSMVGTFTERNALTANTDEARCLARAGEYYGWCYANQPDFIKQPITANFYSGETLLAQETAGGTQPAGVLSARTRSGINSTIQLNANGAARLTYPESYFTQGLYDVRVSSTDGKSASFSFVISSPKSDPIVCAESVTGLSPNGLTAMDPLRISWDPVAGATMYRVDLFNRGQLVDRRETTLTTSPGNYTLPENEHYTYTVTATVPRCQPITGSGSLVYLSQLPQTRCELTVPSCPHNANFGGRNYVGTYIERDDLSANTNRDRCLARPAEYVIWCNTTDSVTAKYYNGSALLGQFTAPGVPIVGPPIILPPIQGTCPSQVSGLTLTRNQNGEGYFLRWDQIEGATRYAVDIRNQATNTVTDSHNPATSPDFIGIFSTSQSTFLLTVTALGIPACSGRNVTGSLTSTPSSRAQGSPVSGTSLESLNPSVTIGGFDLDILVNGVSSPVAISGTPVDFVISDALPGTVFASLRSKIYGPLGESQWGEMDSSNYLKKSIIDTSSWPTGEYELTITIIAIDGSRHVNSKVFFVLSPSDIPQVII